MAPVRASMASSRVVLPLWNGPTSAMHRGPEALVPFCAISASQIRRDAAFSETVYAIVSGRRGIWQEAAASQPSADGTGGYASTACRQNGRPLERPFTHELWYAGQGPGRRCS